MIEIEDLTLRRSDTTVIEGYGLVVERASVLAVLGANGVGKTTLLDGIVGLLRPSAGKVRVEGVIGFVPQLFHATFSYSVLDIVLMGRARHIGLFGAPTTKDYEVARKYLEIIGVGALEERHFNRLSGGQRQLVLIAQALASECEILILDEPCSPLDYRNQEIVIDVLRSLNRDYGLTIVFTTHAPQHALAVASDVLLMRSRTAYRYGPTGDVLTAENLTELYGVEIDRAQFSGSSSYTFAPRFADRAALARPGELT